MHQLSAEYGDAPLTTDICNGATALQETKSYRLPYEYSLALCWCTCNASQYISAVVGVVVE